MWRDDLWRFLSERIFPLDPRRLGVPCVYVRHLSMCGAPAFRTEMKKRLA